MIDRPWLASEPLHELIVNIHKIGQLGWCRATSGNFSMRLSRNELLITASGHDKGSITAEHFLRVDCQGLVLDSGAPEPSAEMALHTQLYNRSPSTNVVLHTHSVQSTAFGKVFPDRIVCLHDYEVLKAFPGVDSHDVDVFIPIFENTQDMGSLSLEVERYLQAHPHTPGYLIRGHGLYTWGESAKDAMRHLEALEYLIECEVALFGLTGQWSGESR